MNQTYKNFLERINKNGGPYSIVDIYHAVRSIPYGSTGVRDPRQVIECNCGSCSGKHLVLRGLLRLAGYEAEIITMFTYFSERTPLVDSFPIELKRICREERISDFHHYVRVRSEGKWLKLDATWHDALIPFGFPVNNAWSGDGDTVLASDPIKEYPNVEDLVPHKLELIASLPADEREKRAAFFSLLTEWISSL